MKQRMSNLYLTIFVDAWRPIRGVEMSISPQYVRIFSAQSNPTHKYASSLRPIFQRICSANGREDYAGAIICLGVDCLVKPTGLRCLSRPCRHGSSEQYAAVSLTGLKTVGQKKIAHDESLTYSHNTVPEGLANTDSVLKLTVSGQSPRQRIHITRPQTIHPMAPQLVFGTGVLAMDGSLERLRRPQGEGVNVLFAHRPDPATPLEEQVQAFQDQVVQGHAREWGVANHPPETLQAIIDLCERKGWEKPTWYQGAYSLLTRGMEKRVLPILRAHGMSFLASHALASGFLTGNHVDADGAPTGWFASNSGYAAPEVAAAMKGFCGWLQGSRAAAGRGGQPLGRSPFGAGRQGRSRAGREQAGPGR